VVSVDFEAEGMLEGVQEGRAREARLELLRTLSAEGFSLDAFARRGSVVASREVRDAAGTATPGRRSGAAASRA
jgi:hypothetical protein